MPRRRRAKAPTVRNDRRFASPENASGAPARSSQHRGRQPCRSLLPPPSIYSLALRATRRGDGRTPPKRPPRALSSAAMSLAHATTPTAPPWYWRLAVFLVRNRYRGGWRLLEIAQRLGLLNKVVRIPVPGGSLD